MHWGKKHTVDMPGIFWDIGLERYGKLPRDFFGLGVEKSVGFISAKKELVRQ